MKPKYNLDEAKHLVFDKRALIGSRARRFLRQHYGDDTGTLIEIFECIEGRDFYKSDALEYKPGVWADIYKPIYDDMTWYVKFFIEGDVPTIEVWSCNWDGCAH